MNLKNKPPVLVPQAQRAELEKLSKAALMDMVWDYAIRCAGVETIDAALAEFRASRDIILEHRSQA